MEPFPSASQAEQSRLPALLPRQVWHLALKLPACKVWMWGQREGWHSHGHLSIWWSVQKRLSVQDIWPEYREEKENSSWRDSVPAEGTRYCSLRRAILATAHNILGSGTLGVLRVGLLMDLLGVDGFNGWSKSAFIYFYFFGSCCKWNFMHFSGCYCLSGLFRSWATLVSFVVDLFSEPPRQPLQWHSIVHFHL